MSEARQEPGAWKVFRLSGHMNLYFARRQMPNGEFEFMQTPSGHPRHFRSLEKVRAAVAKATKEA